MKKASILLMIIALFWACQQKKEAQKQTMLSGEETLWVDESVFPITEDQIHVFEKTYRAKFNLKVAPEDQVVNELVQGNTQIAMLTRKLTHQEETNFRNRNIIPEITRFAIDAIVLITNKEEKDSLITLTEIQSVIRGESQTHTLVFDNPNSSTTNALHQLAGVSKKENKNLFSKSDSSELIKFIAQNKGFIGVMSLNWFTQYPNELAEAIKNIRILKVKGVEGDTYYEPTQVQVGKKTYPLTREIYLLNYQGTSGLGQGLASFLVSDIGQKIVLTSGLAPVKIEQLKINLR